MSSRPYIVHRVANVQPTGQQVGDEWFDPVTNTLFKTLAVNGSAVTASLVPTVLNGNISVSANIISTGAVKTDTGYFFGSNNNFLYQDSSVSTTLLINATTGAYLGFRSNSGVPTVDGPGGQLGLATATVERVRIDNNGNVGVGVNNPGVRLDVAGTIRSTSATIANAASITPTAGTTNQYTITALAQAATILAPSGTPIDGQRLVIRIEDNGTGRALTWTTTSGAYRAVGVTLPTTTVATKVTYVGCIYNSQDIFWDVIAVATQA